MRLLRYVQPPATSASGTTILPAMFFPFRLVALCTSATLGAAVTPIWELQHRAADPTLLIQSRPVRAFSTTAGVVEFATFNTSGAGFTATALNRHGVYPIPEDFWVMPGESLALVYTEGDPTDVQGALVWSLIVP